MSKLFYDHLIVLEEVEDALKAEELGSEEKEELHKLIDEIIHHRILGCILDHLPREHHEEFLERFHKAPYAEDLIVYLQEKTPQDLDIEEKIRKEIEVLKKELLKEITRAK